MAQGVAAVTRSIGRVAGAGTGWLLRRWRRPGVVDQRAAEDVGEAVAQVRGRRRHLGEAHHVHDHPSTKKTPTTPKIMIYDVWYAAA
jgi:hypothetical protein